MRKMRCRVLDLLKETAVCNTAADKLLLESATLDYGKQFTIAFTKWKPSVLIGSSQSLALDVDFEACRKRKISVMRRFSGGQAVYLDENYIVFAMAGPRSFFPASLTELRRQLCELCIKVLRKFEVPADFFAPDNLVINSPRVRTLGNSGQVIKRDAVLVQASIRYDLTDESLKTMLGVLKTNGKSLAEFSEPAKKALASIREFSDAGVDEIKQALVEGIASAYGCEGYQENGTTLEEKSRIGELAAGLVSDMRLEDKPTYVSRGVCYFYLAGRCIVPEIAEFLPYNKPSGPEESTI